MAVVKDHLGHRVVTGMVPAKFDDVAITWAAGKVDTLLFRLAGIDLVKLQLTWSGDEITRVQAVPV